MSEDRAIATTPELAVKAVACPTCHEPAGAECRTPGRRLAPCHMERYELAKQTFYDRRRLAAWNRSVREGG